MPYEGDACVVCKGTKSTNENPIIYCDGDDKSNLENQKCNMPVHKRCYHLKEVPEGDWYCQSCLNKVKKKATIVVCCTTRDGALKPTDVSGKYMHIVCAMWNKSVPDKTEPYTVKESELGLHKCVYCPKKQGLCIQCEEPNCLTRFHATCAIDKGILRAAAVVPDDYSPRCSKHQIKTKSKGRRLRKRSISDDESEEETEEETDEDEDEDESDQDHEDNDDEDEEEEVEPEDKKNKNPLFMAPKKKLALSSNKLIAASASASITKPLKKEIPSKRRTHIEDSSDDDDMGTSNNKKPKNTNNIATYRKNSALGISLNNNSNSNNSSNNSNSNNNISNTNSVSNTSQQRPEGLSYRDRFKKPDLELIPSLLNEIKRPFSNPNPSPSTLDDHLRRQQQLQQQSQIQQPSPQQPNKNSPLVELNRLREEVKKLNHFKQKVTEVFLALNVPVPASVSSPSIDIESYVDYLRQTIQRVGPVKDEEMDQIKDYAELLVNKSKSK